MRNGGKDLAGKWLGDFERPPQGEYVRTGSASFLSERQRIVSFSAFQADSASPCFVSAHTATRDAPVTLPPLHLTEAREGKIRSTAMLLAVDRHNMAGLRLPSCQNVERVVEWLVIHRAAEECRSAGGASQQTQQLTDPATVIT
jgi:hypothetical protein